MSSPTPITRSRPSSASSMGSSFLGTPFVPSPRAGATPSPGPQMVAAAIATVSNIQSLQNIEEQFRGKVSRAAMKGLAALIEDARDQLALEQAKCRCPRCGVWFGEQPGGAYICATCVDTPLLCARCIVQEHVEIVVVLKDVAMALHHARSQRSAANDVDMMALEAPHTVLILASSVDPGLIAAAARDLRAARNAPRDVETTPQTNSLESITAAEVVAAENTARRAIEAAWRCERFTCDGVDSYSIERITVGEVVDRGVVEREAELTAETTVLDGHRALTATSSAHALLSRGVLLSTSSSLIDAYTDALEEEYEEQWRQPLTTSFNDTVLAAWQSGPLTALERTEGVARRHLIEAEASEWFRKARPMKQHVLAMAMRGADAELTDRHSAARDEVWAAAQLSIVEVVGWRYGELQELRAGAMMLQRFFWLISHHPREPLRRTEILGNEEQEWVALIYAAAVSAEQVRETERRRALVLRHLRTTLMTGFLQTMEVERRELHLAAEAKLRVAVARAYSRTTRLDRQSIGNLVDDFEAVMRELEARISASTAEALDATAHVVTPSHAPALCRKSLIWIDETMQRLDDSAFGDDSASICGSLMATTPKSSSARRSGGGGGGASGGGGKLRGTFTLSSKSLKRGLRVGTPLASATTGLKRRESSLIKFAAPAGVGESAAESTPPPPALDSTLRPSNGGGADGGPLDDGGSDAGFGATFQNSFSTRIDWVDVPPEAPPCALSIVASLLAPPTFGTGSGLGALTLLENELVLSKCCVAGQDLIRTHSEADLFATLFADYDALVAETAQQLKHSQDAKRERERLRQLEAVSQSRRKTMAAVPTAAAASAAAAAAANASKGSAVATRLREAVARGTSSSSKVLSPPPIHHPLYDQSSSFFSSAFLMDEAHPSLRKHLIGGDAENENVPGRMSFAARVRQRPHSALAVHYEHQRSFPLISPSRHGGGHRDINAQSHGEEHHYHQQQQMPEAAQPPRQGQRAAVIDLSVIEPSPGEVRADPMAARIGFTTDAAESVLYSHGIDDDPLHSLSAIAATADDSTHFSLTVVSTPPASGSAPATAAPSIAVPTHQIGRVRELIARRFHHRHPIDTVGAAAKRRDIEHKKTMLSAKKTF